MDGNLIIGAIGGASAMYFVARGPIPFFDDGSSINPTTSAAAMDDTVAALKRSAGLKIRFKLNTPQVKRLICGAKVYNFSSHDILQDMHNPGSGDAHVVSNPWKAAREFADYMHGLGKGYKVEIIGEFDPDVPKGCMVGVRSSATPNQLLVFRRHALVMMTKTNLQKIRASRNPKLHDARR